MTEYFSIKLNNFIHNKRQKKGKKKEKQKAYQLEMNYFKIKAKIKTKTTKTYSKDLLQPSFFFLVKFRDRIE